MTREHGTYVKYVQDHCRCGPCRAARSEYTHARNRQAAPPYVAAGRARAHLEELRAAGVGLKTVAKRSGISHGALSKMMYGDRTRNRGPSKRIRPETEQAILAVTPIDAADGAYIDAARTWQHVETLLERGWSKAAIGRAVHGPQAVSLQLSREQVTAKNARTIEGLLDQPVVTKGHRHGPLPVPELDDEPERTVEDLPGLHEPIGDIRWMRRAVCRRPEYPTWMFFPGHGDPATAAAAKAVCQTCPVTDECRQYALSFGTEILPGIWGGTSEKQRRRLRREVA